ncbi:MFS transporter [Gorillibacterium sp. sgz5001074]|uniref:MFS transporter n=1 Tax=Gorillibacterium sp. sgz5001074 TaxID=3446695 RepID=UPI003F6705E0
MPHSSKPQESLGSAAANKWLILANLCIGTFMSTLDGSIANVALPTISTTVHAPVHDVQWVLTSYLLTICATLPIMGKLSDLLGRSRVYNFGFLLFAAGSALCAWSGTLPLLILSRIIQALGASCLMTNSQAIVAEVFTSGDRGRALGIVGTMVSVGSLTGPGIGGVLVDHYGWPSIFWINVPIGLIGFAAGLFILPKDRAAGRREPFDVAGSILFMAGIVSLLYTLSNAQDWGWSSASSVTGLTAAGLLLVVFYLWERRLAHPMLDFGLYRIRAFATGNVAALLSFVALFCINVMMPFYMEDVLGFSPEITGYTMMMNPLAMAIVAPLSGWLSDRIGPNLLTTAGLAVNALGFALLNTLGAGASAWQVGAHLVLFGIGGGLFQSPNNSSVMGSVPKPKLGIAGGLNALVRNVGMVTGIALSVSIYSTRLSQLGGGSRMAPGVSADLVISALHAVFWTAAGICVLALLVSVRRMGGSKPSPQQAS